jgi:hypothetical protein
MTGDREKFLILQKERDGPVSFRNDDLIQNNWKMNNPNWEQELKGIKFSISRRYEKLSFKCESNV